MLHSRVFTAGALVLMLTGAATAQSSSPPDTTTPGKPTSLLQILLKPASSQPAQDDAAMAAAADPAEAAQPEHKAHTRVVHKHKSVRKYAHRKDQDEATAQSPVTDQPPANDAQASDPVANTPASPDPSNMSAMVVDGHTVQVASPNQVNMMDLSAGDTPSPPQPAMTAPEQTTIGNSPQASADPQQQSAVAPAQSAAMDEQPAAADQKPETIQPVVALAEVTPQDDSGSNTRDLWYEKVIAALGGAFVASSIAWLLIGWAPPRRSEPMLRYETERMTR